MESSSSSEDDDFELLSIHSNSDHETTTPTVADAKKKEPGRKVNKSEGGSDEVRKNATESSRCIVKTKSGSESNKRKVIRKSNKPAPESDEDEGIDDREEAEPGRHRDGASAGQFEITLSGDEDEESENDSETRALGDSSISTEPSSSCYGLRRKRKINYAEVENCPGLEDAEGGSTEAKKVRRETLNVFALSPSKLEKIIRDPSQVDSYAKCSITFSDGTDSATLTKVLTFFKKNGNLFEHAFISVRQDEEAYTFLKNALKMTPILSRIHYRYRNREDAFEFLKILQELRTKDHLRMLSSLKLVSITGAESLTERHVSLLASIPANFTCVELGDALWENVKSATLKKFLESQKTSLETLIIHGGFRGSTMKERIVITFPKMVALKTLCICPQYGFVSEIRNPHSKKERVVKVEGDQDEPYKVAIKFSSDLPKLTQLVLGNLIEIEDLAFSTLRKLSEFKCGSYWNLSITFPPENSRKTLLESEVTDLQLPDALKDPLFVVKVAKHFPNVQSIYINLPSVPVLRAFFKAFEDSKLETLYLKTQFDFESTMESCLLPRMSDVLKKSEATESIIRTLREYKHFDEYVRYHNIELPVEAEDLMEGHSEGIRALKKLKALHLEHIPRKLLIPIPDDERKWYDHNCKFMSTTFGYTLYPMNRKCHKEILRLDLSEYTWKNIEIRSEFTDDFYEAGFVDIPEEIIETEAMNSGNYSTYAEEEEDLFIPVNLKKSSGTRVKIMPSMLFPVFKAKSE